MTMHYEQKIRYARNISLPEIGEAGQAILLQSRVLVVGAGGLGSPLLLYLAAAGVGHIGIIDDDEVELSNLQRQIVFETSDVGDFKASAAAEALHDLNPTLDIQTYTQRLDADNIATIISQYNIVVDGSDNFPTRFLINDACMKAGKTLVSAAVSGFEGQVYTFTPNGPCYRCIYGDIPPEGTAPRCSESGVLGSVAGVVGTLQATEVIKELLGRGSLAGYMLLYNGLNAEMRKVAVSKDDGCDYCG